MHVCVCIYVYQNDKEIIESYRKFFKLIDDVCTILISSSYDRLFQRVFSFYSSILLSILLLFSKSRVIRVPDLLSVEHSSLLRFIPSLFVNNCEYKLETF